MKTPLVGALPLALLTNVWCLTPSRQADWSSGLRCRDHESSCGRGGADGLGRHSDLPDPAVFSVRFPPPLVPGLVPGSFLWAHEHLACHHRRSISGEPESGCLDISLDGHSLIRVLI